LYVPIPNSIVQRNKYIVFRIVLHRICISTVLAARFHQPNHKQATPAAFFQINLRGYKSRWKQKEDLVKKWIKHPRDLYSKGKRMQLTQIHSNNTAKGPVAFFNGAA
jgi:hypothetical protein